MHWIRVVYLYLFATVGLVLLTIGGVQLVGLGLRTLILTEADAEMRIIGAPLFGYHWRTIRRERAGFLV